MPAKESMEKFAARRAAEGQARKKARDNPPAPGGHKLSKDTKDSKGPSRNAWMENATTGKTKREK